MKMTPMALLRRKFSRTQSQSHSAQESSGIKPDGEIPSNESVNEELSFASSAQSQKDVFMIKVSQCKKMITFNVDSIELLKARELKRRALVELVEFVNALNQNKANATTFFSESALKDIISMIKINIFEETSYALDDYDPEEDDPVMDPKWAHKQVVYELLLRVIISPGVNAKVAKKQGMFDQSFIIELIQRFESEDSRERDYLKSILHRLYGKFFTHRKYIREQISYVFSIVIDNKLKHSGIAELLEILGSIINGFSLPLKKEHLAFLKISLLPLHKTDCLSLYQQQLVYCMTQYVEKNNKIAPMVIQCLSHIWPIGSSTKQMIFLIELEAILEIIHPITEDNGAVMDSLLPHILYVLNQAMSGHHFQVAEKALSFWNNINLTSADGLLGLAYAEKVLPLILPSLLKNTRTETRHWNEAVAILTERTLMIYQQALGEPSLKRIIEQTEKDIARKKQDEADRWANLLSMTK